MKDKIFDAIIVGGSYAGLSAAMALGRSLRDVLIIDGGKPCNRQTPHAHNLIAHDGNTPSEIAAKAREQVLAYPTVHWLNDWVTEVKGLDPNFSVTTSSAQTFHAKKILLATGVKDIMPDLKGFSESWGISVLHCPYCHGYEVRQTALGVLANGEMGYEMSKLISQWSKTVTLFTNGKATLTDDQRKILEQHHIPVIEKEISELVHEKGYLSQLLFKDGTTHPLHALFAKIPAIQHSDMAVQLGCTMTDTGHIAIDALQKTNVKGIYAAGDCTTMFRSLSAAIASGGLAGAMMNRELIDNSF